MNVKEAILILAVFLVLTLMVGAVLILRNNGSPLIQSASAKEIYPIFSCPCCSQPLDKNNICCGAAQERIDYIDSLMSQKLPEKEIILTYIKKYGLDSLVDKQRQEQARAWLVESAPQDRPIIGITTELYDFGDISEAEGVAVTFFDLKNEGKKDLIINKLDSSCGCTSAAIIFRGAEGPRFAMAGHGINSPTGWEVVIPPGENAQLKVYYDPSVHPDLRGPVTREVSIFSNDPINFEKKVKIELNQVD